MTDFQAEADRMDQAVVEAMAAALDLMADQIEAQFEVGDLVVNFGQTARVVGFHHSGLLILQGNGLDCSAGAWGQKWLADPDLTQHVLL